jgi:hypothetical protein
MDDFRFKTLEELYRKLLPALNAKVADLKRNKIINITEEDIWNYLKNNYWKNKKDLTLGEMVNDILTTPNIDLQEYKIKNKSSSLSDIL